MKSRKNTIQTGTKGNENIYPKQIKKGKKKSKSVEVSSSHSILHSFRLFIFPSARPTVGVVNECLNERPADESLKGDRLQIPNFSCQNCV